jgi:hypothetical protein
LISVKLEVPSGCVLISLLPVRRRRVRTTSQTGYVCRDFSWYFLVQPLKLLNCGALCHGHLIPRHLQFLLVPGPIISCCRLQSEVLTAPLRKSQISKCHKMGRAMAQAVSRRPLTTEARVRSQVKSMWDLWWTKWHWDRFFSEFRFSPVNFIPLVLHYL